MKMLNPLRGNVEKIRAESQNKKTVGYVTIGPISLLFLRPRGHRLVKISSDDE